MRGREKVRVSERGCEKGDGERERGIASFHAVEYASREGLTRGVKRGGRRRKKDGTRIRCGGNKDRICESETAGSRERRRIDGRTREREVQRERETGARATETEGGVYDERERVARLRHVLNAN